MYIRKASKLDLDDVLYVERAAFGQENEAELVRKLENDPSAKPSLSLLAFQGERAVGHILFTTSSLMDAPKPVSSSILAPLAVVPDAQKQGIGGKLIKKGLQFLSTSGVDLVFVLGDPAFYTLHGFEPAGKLGLEAPYPIPEQYAEAWMVQALRPGLLGFIKGKVICADALNKPEYWRE